MHPISSLPLSPFSLLLDHVRAWPVQSQQGARRNAMIACTTLAARRAERQEVEDFLEALTPSSPHPLPVALHR